MSSKMPPASPATLSPSFGRVSRRDSIASQSTVSQADKEQLAQALDKIHNSASQADVLTTFNDFQPPPSAAAPVAEPKGAAGDLVQQGLSGFYSRLKEAVGVGKPVASDAEDDGGLYRSSANSSHTRSKSSISSLPHGDSSATVSTFNPTLVEIPAAAAATTTDDHSQPLPSSKPSSSAMASTAVVIRAPAPAVVDTTIAAGAVGMYCEPMRDSGPRTEEFASNGRRKLPRQNDPLGPIYSAASSIYDGPMERNTTDLSDVASVARLSIQDDGSRHSGSPDIGRSPTKSTGPYLASSTGSVGSGQLAVNFKLPAGISPLSPPSERSLAAASPISTSAHNSVHHESFALDTRPQRLQSGQMRIPGTKPADGTTETVSARLEHMRKQILGKEFWMADETCKECFQCGDPFSAFRRKHHCRTCGWIFDSKCTSTISGEKFGVPGNLRVCKKCLDIINSRYENDSDDSDDPRLTSLLRSNNQKAIAPPPRPRADDERSILERSEDLGDGRMATTPMISVPATRRIGNSANRNSAILEIDAAPQLSRPSSSRSLRSMASVRPSSSGHVRHHSKHNYLWNIKTNSDDRVPFRKDLSDEMSRRSKLSAFHDDNIIDPELAPYMSDESSGDEQMSIFSTLAKDTFSTSLDPEKPNFGSFLSAGRSKHRRQGEKSISGLSFTSRGMDDGGGSPSVASHARATGRRRNMSSVSLAPGQHHLRSPRSKIGGFKGPSMSTEALGSFDLFGNAEAGLNMLRPSSSSRPDVPRLNAPSIKHTRRLFRQLLDDAAIPNPTAWEKALIPILRHCAEEVDPNTREGDRMDIRHYVKLKKIPGGKPADSTYVSGVIFTKNLALKSMPRRIVNPRILIVSFPIEYQRQQEHQFMSLEPVMSQEKEFLKMVVARIRSHEPEVVLAQRNVAGLALQSLADAGIAVAYNVKPSVIGAVARFTGTPIISSMDMLSLPITIGRCADFEVKTFVNNDIPGRKKTYIFVSGCEKFLGCTIALRGTSTELLSRMKKITEFMVYVVYNLKLESSLLSDGSVRTSADTDGMSMPSTTRQSSATDSRKPAEDATSPIHAEPATPSIEAAADAAPADDQEAAEPTDASVTASADPAAPAPDVAAASPVASLQTTQTRQIPEVVPAPSFYSDMVEKYKTKILSASPFVKFTQPYLLMKAREQETRLLYLKRLRDQDLHEETGETDNSTKEEFQLINPEMVHELGKKVPRQVMEVLHAVHDAEYDKALYAYETQTRQWENYIQGNLDLFDPHSHQNIVVLHSVTCTETKIPCLEPELIGISYYNELPDPSSPMSADCTLGQYVQDLCDGAEELCHANGCDRPMWQHHRTYVHGEARVTVFVEPEAKLPSEPLPSSKGDAPDDDDDEVMYIWSYCKTCRRDLAVNRLSEMAWKYSFGKYLEMLFWSQSLRLVDDTQCLHDCQKEHIHYFHYRGSSVRIHYDPIDLLEVVVPRARITWKVDHDLKLKNEAFLRIQERWILFITSVTNRIQSIRIDSVLPEKAENCRAEVERLAQKAQEERPQLIRALQQAYMQCKHYEVVPLNGPMRTMAYKSAEWDAAFAQFEADFLSDKDVRQFTVMQLKKIFTDNESKESLPATDGTSVLSLETDTKASASQTLASSTGDVEGKAEEATAGEEATEAEAPEAESPEAATDTVKEATEEAAVKEGPPTEPDAPAEPEVALHKPPMPPRAATEPEVSTTANETVASDPRSGAVSPVETRKQTSPSSSQELPAVATVRNSSSASVSGLPGPTRSTRSNRTGAATPTPQQSLTEKVEQLRREFQAQMPEGSQAGQPATATPANNTQTRQAGASRKAGAKVSPPVVRSATQPSGVGPRGLPNLSRQTSRDAKALAGDSGQSGNAPMDVLGKVDKKFTDRMGLGALKAHRKPGQSAIPRFVHKKKENKVTNLAKQLTREFERERNRERMRAAKQHHARPLFPRSSVRAIVEVYEDINQAVQEPEPEQGPTDNEHMFASQNSDEQEEKATPDRTDAGTAENGTAQAPDQMESEPPSQQSSDNTADTATETEEPRPDQDQDQEQEQEQEGKHADSAAASEDEGGSDGDQSLEDILPDVETIAEHLEPSGTVPSELQKDKKSNLLKMLGNFWAERSATGWPPLDYPMHASDHIFMESNVIVREDEPSSLIAFAMSSRDYITKLRGSQLQARLAAQKEREAAGSSSGSDADSSDSDEAAGLEMKRSRAGAEDTAVVPRATVARGSAQMVGAAGTVGMVDGADGAGASGVSRGPGGPRSGELGNVGDWSDRSDRSELDMDEAGLAGVSWEMDEAEMEFNLLRQTGTHLKYQFTEGSARMMCKIFFAEQFDALRRKCGVADRIVESLSRCLKWDSKGGKTKSVFLKTLDDRLVMKSLSQVETAAFVQFAPSYFRIMAESLFHDLPSVIAKMLGFYQVVIKNPTTATEIRLDLLVMENLFYDRQETRKFDLKGSMRNRKIQSTGEQNEVLLDENMVEYIYESPLFAREHAKKLLRASVWNDTLFLARQNVMDYSLMVAVDASRKELVVGIIDCIRTYTWDKKLESWIKDRGFAGGGRNRPTVTSPKEYKSRFREAMERYILQAPNCWHLFGSVGYHPALAPRARFEGYGDD